MTVFLVTLLLGLMELQLKHHRAHKRSVDAHRIAQVLRRIVLVEMVEQTQRRRNPKGDVVVLDADAEIPRQANPIPQGLARVFEWATKQIAAASRYDSGCIRLAENHQVEAGTGEKL